jgi:hypothetical protein
VALVETKKLDEPLVCKHHLLLLLKYILFIWTDFDYDLFYLAKHRHGRNTDDQAKINLRGALLSTWWKPTESSIVLCERIVQCVFFEIVMYVSSICNLFFKLSCIARNLWLLYCAICDFWFISSYVHNGMSRK